MKNYKIYLFALVAFFSLSCQNTNSEGTKVSGEKSSMGEKTSDIKIFDEDKFAVENGPNHKPWTELLQKHVDKKGMVDYKGFKKDIDKLDAYLKTLSDDPAKKSWSEDEQLAYWINAYNAFAIKLVVDNYPVKSIKDLGPSIKIPVVSDVWHYEFFQIGGKDYSLDQIEHGTIRKQFNEPRIHFAVNCASISCPPLLDEAYVPSMLDKQLTAQAERFVNDEQRNEIAKESIEVSSIFNWFKGDFTKNGSLIKFLNTYSKTKINENAKVKYMNYDWSLNDQ
jgi:hypothetical protein